MKNNILLEVKSVSKVFSKRVQALKNISFCIRHGEIIALLGDNGAGKSTLIKIISGYYSQYSGEIFWKGEKILWPTKTGTKKAREIGIQTLYQDLGLIEQLSVIRNFFLGNEICNNKILNCLNLKKMKEIVTKEIADMSIKRNIDPLEPVANLSGGERQILAICRAKYFKSKLLILDEPTNALSLSQKREVYKVIKKAAISGIAIIFITHSLENIAELVDRYIIINHGELKADLLKNKTTKEELEKLITEF